MKKEFGTIINCMDGRVQEPALAYLREKFDTAYIDSITEAGPVRILAGNEYIELKQSILDRLKISLVNHKSSFVAIAAHYDCAGNPLSEEQQKKQLIKSADYLKSLDTLEVPVLCLWIDENFTVREIS